MRKAALELKIRELTWQNLVQTCTISDQSNQIVQLRSMVTHFKTELQNKDEEALNDIVYRDTIIEKLTKELEETKTANVLLQNENDAGMYKLADVINSLVIERDSFKEESENYKRLYFEQRHAKEQAEAKIKALEQALNFNEMVQRLSVISDLSFGFCKTLDDVAEEAKRERAKVKANDLIDEMCKQLSGEIEELLKVKGLYHFVRVSIHKSY